MENPDNILKTNIALWGTTGSGKSWLINAFAKELTWYTENDRDFIYSLRDGDNVPIRAIRTPNDQDIAATLRAEDHVWTFERRGRDKNSRSHQVSSHAHQIVVHDNPGSHLEKAAESGLSDESIVSSVFQNSQNIILVLDPTAVRDSPIVEANMSPLTKNDYGMWMESLIDGVLAKNPGKKLRIAVCISKADLVQIQLTNEEIIKIIFGEGLLRALDLPNIEKRLFKVSSVGYIKKSSGGRRTSNIDDRKSGDDKNRITLLDENNWNPINVVTPFFWQFEAIERERIRNNNFLGDREKYYKAYPPPRSI